MEGNFHHRARYLSRMSGRASGSKLCSGWWRRRRGRLSRIFAWRMGGGGCGRTVGRRRGGRARRLGGGRVDAGGVVVGMMVYLASTCWRAGCCRPWMDATQDAGCNASVRSSAVLSVRTRCVQTALAFVSFLAGSFLFLFVQEAKKQSKPVVLLCAPLGRV